MNFNKYPLKVKITYYSKKMLRTVENAQNAIGDHEYTSHGKNKKMIRKGTIMRLMNIK